MMKYIYLLLTFPLISSVSQVAHSQDDVKPSENYDFKIVYESEASSVKNQQKTGTCWSFCTSSYVESEMLRLGQNPADLSEMYIVRNIYRQKFENYIRRQGKANFGEGGLSHDFMSAYIKNGMVPESIYSGLRDGQTQHNHSELESVLKGMADGILKKSSGELSDVWADACEAILDVYLGTVENEFEFEGKIFTPESFAKDRVGVDGQDYLELTSYSHQPFYYSFVLEIPDNFANGSYYNLPLNEMYETAINALKNGYSIAWDGDVSEKGFSPIKGLAILPEAGWEAKSKSERSMAFESPVTEMEVDQEMRQSTFDNYSTTDDHLMHITGMVEDQNGTKYFTVKNSWGTIGKYDGYLYMSEAYFKLKTVAILVHKEAVPKEIMKKLK